MLYLRVSTKRQLDTAVDIDPDGNSIATQRKAGHRRADGLGAAVVKEFVEPYSAKTVDDRKIFRELLTFIQANPEIKYLIVYMRRGLSVTASTPPSLKCSSRSLACA